MSSSPPTGRDREGLDGRARFDAGQSMRRSRCAPLSRPAAARSGQVRGGSTAASGPAKRSCDRGSLATIGRLQERFWRCDPRSKPSGTSRCWRELLQLSAEDWLKRSPSSRTVLGAGVPDGRTRGRSRNCGKGGCGSQLRDRISTGARFGGRAMGEDSRCDRSGLKGNHNALRGWIANNSEPL